MKALWIRVEAHRVDSLEIAQLAEALGCEPVTALGYDVALGGAIAEHTESGMIADVPNATIERWARWAGKKGEFARAVREFLQDGDGRYDNFLDMMGKLVERRAKDRKRKADERLKDREADEAERGALSLFGATSAGMSTDSPRKDLGHSSATVRNGTVRTTTTRQNAEKQASARPGDPTFDGCMLLVREKLYVPDGAPPSSWAAGRDGSILKKLHEHYSYDDIARAIAGVAILRDHPGKYGDIVDWLVPNSKATLRVLYKTKSGVLPMFNLATSAFWKHADSIFASTADTDER